MENPLTEQPPAFRVYLSVSRLNADPGQDPCQDEILFQVA